MCVTREYKSLVAACRKEMGVQGIVCTSVELQCLKKWP